MNQKWSALKSKSETFQIDVYISYHSVYISCTVLIDDTHRLYYAKKWEL